MTQVSKILILDTAITFYNEKGGMLNGKIIRI